MRKPLLAIRQSFANAIKERPEELAGHHGTTELFMLDRHYIDNQERLAIGDEPLAEIRVAVLSNKSGDVDNCPFCGGDDIKVHESCDRDLNNEPIFSQVFWYVTCRDSDCFFAGPKSYESRDHAVKKWNTRAV